MLARLAPVCRDCRWAMAKQWRCVKTSELTLMSPWVCHSKSLKMELAFTVLETIDLDHNM